VRRAAHLRTGLLTSEWHRTGDQVDWALERIEATLRQDFS
jgi:hypothetical protein